MVARLSHYAEAVFAERFATLRGGGAGAPAPQPQDLKRLLQVMHLRGGEMLIDREIQSVPVYGELARETSREAARLNIGIDMEPVFLMSGAGQPTVLGQAMGRVLPQVTWSTELPEDGGVRLLVSAGLAMVGGENQDWKRGGRGMGGAPTVMPSTAEGVCRWPSC